ncbi:hypothetical protein BDZ45DRAFT_670240 [Acephala macrosclerotiorum]|nr:hypothetical protein BDZ45DRAFT_670240 [Acephala macrosclerotiorum]
MVRQRNRRTSSKLSSSAAHPLKRLIPNNSVEDPNVVILPSFVVQTALRQSSPPDTSSSNQQSQIMAPPIETFPAHELPYRTQINAKSTRRKGFNGDLKGCELMEMLQYVCEVEEPRSRESVTRCWPVQRWFRKCQDRNGTFMVETTAWEGRKVG